MFASTFRAQTLVYDWNSVLHRPKNEQHCILESEWDRMKVSVHSQLCPLLSQIALGPDVCSQLNCIHSTTVTACLEEFRLLWVLL